MEPFSLAMRNFFTISKYFLLVFVVLLAGVFIWCALELQEVRLERYFAWIAIPIGLLAIFISKGNYLSPIFAFVAPWILVIEFSSLEISNIFRTASKSAVIVISIALCAGLIAGATRLKSNVAETEQLNIFSAKKVIAIGLIAYLLLTALQVGLAGYIPLIRGLLTGDTGYQTFGIHSIYGFYNAFATALATTSMYVYFLTKRRLFLIAPICIFTGFIFFVTRQNLLTLLVQWLVVYSLINGVISRKKLLISIIFLLTLFAAAGQLRSGDIRELIQLKDQYYWLPSAFIWIFAYMYFNVLNLDNTISDVNVPFFDGRSMFTLIPSSFRPDFEKAGHLQVSNFTVSSFLDIVVADGGIVYVIVFVITVIWCSNYLYRRAKNSLSLLTACSYSTLYFCALFSFFSNFWLYLPVIAQLIFFVIFSKLIKGRTRSTK